MRSSACTHMWVCSACAYVCKFFNKSGKLITHHYTLGMTLKFQISSRGRTTDNTAVRVLLNALHFYTVMTIHLFIILTSGIHSAIAGRGGESSAPGKALTPHTHFLSFFQSHQLLFVSLPCLLCVSLLGQRSSVRKMQGNWIMKF